MKLMKYMPNWFKYRFCKGNHSQGYCFHVTKDHKKFIAYCDHCGYYSETKWKYK